MDSKPIKTKADYEAALKSVEGLMSAEANTPDGDRLNVFITLIEAYERQHFPMLLPNATTQAAMTEARAKAIARGRVISPTGGALDSAGNRINRKDQGKAMKKLIEIEKSSGNVYADLGFEDAAAMQIKSALTMRIADVIKARRYSQIKAAEVTGLPQPKLSAILRGHFHGVSECNLLGCLTALGQDVKIVVTPNTGARHCSYTTQRGIDGGS